MKDKLPMPPDLFQLDLHVHTEAGSPCSMIDPRDLAERVLEESLRTLVVTDHASLEGARCLRDLLAGADVSIIPGIEATTDWGDFLVFAPEETLVVLEETLAAGRLPFGFLKEAGFLSRENLVIWAHPFSAGAAGLHPPDSFEAADLDMILGAISAIEGINGVNLPYDQPVDRPNPYGSPNSWACAFAEGVGLPITYGSDAHVLADFATVTTCLDRPVRTCEDLLDAVRGGAILDTTERYLGPRWREHASG